MENNDKINIIPFAVTPIMQVQLDLDLEKLTELTFQIQNNDTEGVQSSNRGGWQSDDIGEETHEEFIRLTEEIEECLQIYHSEIFKGMQFKEDITHSLTNMWININQKNHYNEWHIHRRSTLSGVYYIKHDGFENGNIMFKHPNHLYMTYAHWPQEVNGDENWIERHNEVTSEILDFVPIPNMLIIFPSWIEHKVEVNLNNDSRISLSFNTMPTADKKYFHDVHKNLT